MIRACCAADFEQMLAVINDAATAYRGVIPADRWREPYMPAAELRHELQSGVVFSGYYDETELLAVMGAQQVLDVTLIRHAYVRSAHRRRGIGGELLRELLAAGARPFLVGTWAAATWAVSFYEKHGFRPVSPLDTPRLLRKYWSIPERQIETSIVLADRLWWDRN